MSQSKLLSFLCVQVSLSLSRWDEFWLRGDLMKMRLVCVVQWKVIALQPFKKRYVACCFCITASTNDIIIMAHWDFFSCCFSSRWRLLKLTDTSQVKLIIQKTDCFLLRWDNVRVPVLCMLPHWDTWWSWAIVNQICFTCTFPAATSQNVCCEKRSIGKKKQQQQ